MGALVRVIMGNKQHQNVMLVVGASGIVGRAALQYFHGLNGWRAIGVSRRAPDLPGVEHVQLDLADDAACANVVGGFHDVTHVIYAALFEKPGLLAGWVEADQMQTNLRMLQNLLVPLQQVAKRLQHVSLLQGTKAYGAHVGVMSVPGKERAPRVDHPNFYWLQEDWLKEQRRGAPWRFTIWRPPLIVGHAFGAPMNVLSAIGLYGALESALAESSREGFGWPGGRCAPIDAVDADLLARAFGWAVAAEQDAAANDSQVARVLDAAADQTFNITNGDVVVLSEIWPRLAQCFGLLCGSAAPQLLQKTLPARAGLWSELVRRHKLKSPGLEQFAGDSLIYADVFFNAGNDEPMPSTLLSTLKIRQAGFAHVKDSEDMFVDWIKRLQQERVLPPVESAH